jgi:hypothetical protein
MSKYVTQVAGGGEFDFEIEKRKSVVRHIYLNVCDEQVDQDVGMASLDLTVDDLKKLRATLDEVIADCEGGQGTGK